MEESSPNAPNSSLCTYFPLHSASHSISNDVNSVHLPTSIKKRNYHEAMSGIDYSSDDMGSCDPPPTKLRRLVASYWNDIPPPDLHERDHGVNESNYQRDSPDWKEITKRPPSSGSYIYDETYDEESPYVWKARQGGICDNDEQGSSCRIPASQGEVPIESLVPEAYSSPSTFNKQPVELSFESDDEMDKKPAAITNYSKNVRSKYSNDDADDEESIALAPLGPSRRTTAAHDALFSMSPKPMSLDGTKLLEKAEEIQFSTPTVKPTLEHLSVPLAKLHRKDHSSRLGHDSMSYSTDETDQVPRPLPYLSAAMLPKQPPNVLSDTDEEEELLLMTNTRTSAPTTTTGWENSIHHGNSLPSVTPSPNVLKQQQCVLKMRNGATPVSTDRKSHRPLNASGRIIRPTPLKAPPPASTPNETLESDFLNRMENLFTSRSDRRYNAFQPVSKRNEYQELHSIISDMIQVDGVSNTATNLLPPTPIRHTPKMQYNKSPFKPITAQEYEERIDSDRTGAPSNGRVLRSIPRFTPSPARFTPPQAKVNMSYERYEHPHHSMMDTTPKTFGAGYHEEPMEWEHPLRQATPTMMVTDFAPTPPRYDIHFSLSGPSKIGPPVPSEVLVVPTTYVSTTNGNSKSEAKSIKSAPPKTTIRQRPSLKVASTGSTGSPMAAYPIHQIYATNVNTTAVIPTKETPVHPSPYVNPTSPIAVTVNRKNRRTVSPYVPPAPIDGPAHCGWGGGMAGTTGMNNCSDDDIQWASLHRNGASAVVSGPGGYYHSIHTPKDEYSSPHHLRMTTNTATGQFRDGNHNCMSSCSSSSLSNSTKFGSRHPCSTTHYEQYEA